VFKINKPKIGIMLGDPAGIGPEIVVKSLMERTDQFEPVIIGNHDCFQVVLDSKHAALGLDTLVFHDTSCQKKIKMGTVSAESGRMIDNSMKKAVSLLSRGEIEALILGPITKQALKRAHVPYESEFQFFSSYFKKKFVQAVVKARDYFRISVVGHCAFRDIVSRLTTEGIVRSGLQLLDIMKLFGKQEMGIAVAALNPHASENGLFGDEEKTIITPAIEILRKHTTKVIGPCPADTVLMRMLSHEVGGIVYLYHDQGNIAYKSRFFGEGVLIYTNLPVKILSVGHGSALEIAGKDRADPQNMINCIDTALEMIHK
jgi:4-phospho-D-threonate 3-dehydrogenase / 4-phospho-D-erythronate 3-dehydrogenase